MPLPNGTITIPQSVEMWHHPDVLMYNADLRDIYITQSEIVVNRKWVAIRVNEICTAGHEMRNCNAHITLFQCKIRHANLDLREHRSCFETAWANVLSLNEQQGGRALRLTTSGVYTTDRGNACACLDILRTSVVDQFLWQVRATIIQQVRPCNLRDSWRRGFHVTFWKADVLVWRVATSGVVMVFIGGELQSVGSW